MANRFPKTGYGCGGVVAPKMAEGGVVSPQVGRDGVPDVTRLESLMRSAGGQEMDERGARFQSQSGQDAADAAHKRMQMLAEMAMRARQGKSEPSMMGQMLNKKADGGVVAPRTADPLPPTGAMGWAQSMLRKLMANPMEAAAKIGNTAPKPAADTDISIVRRAAEEAGRRNEEAQQVEAEQKKKQPQYGSYPK